MPSISAVPVFPSEWVRGGDDDGLARSGQVLLAVEGEDALRPR